MKFSEWRAGFSAKYTQYMSDLTRLGEETAQELFGAVDPSYGNGGVAVSREVTGNGSCTIRASGEDAAFIEFGTGVGVSYNPAFNIRSDFPIEDGSWSREHNGPYAKRGYWFYKTADGEKLMLKGTPAMGGMQEACIRMQNESPEIARRVFR